MAHLQSTSETPYTERCTSSACWVETSHSKEHTPQHDASLFDLRKLHNRKKQADRVIEILRVRLNYLKHKDQESAKKDQFKRRRSEELDRVRRKSQEIKELKEDAKRRQQEEIQKKIEANHGLRYSMEYNRSLASNMISAKKQREVQRVKSVKRRLQEQHEDSVNKLKRELSEKARKMKQEKMYTSDKSQVFFITKMMQLKGIKERKLSFEMKVKRKNEQRLEQLRETESRLLRKVAFSQKYRSQCEEDYYSSLVKYRQFCKAKVGSRNRSTPQSQSFSEGNNENIVPS